jgi:curved DNA-binding protein CbpA
MNYYTLLGVPTNATTDEIKKHYRKNAKIHHPDKGGDEEHFKLIHVAYETLMDPILRHHYDMELSGQTYTFTQEDYDIILKYYNSFIQSVEVRLMMSLFYSVPENVRSKVNLSTLFKKNKSSTALIQTKSIKYIDATQLYDDITLHLKRPLNDVFKRVLKQLIVKTRTTYYHLFIIDSDYDIYLYNDQESTIKLELTTLPDHNFYKQGYNLCYIKKIDLYEYYYGATFQIQLPTKFTICCIANQLTQKKTSSIDTFGFYNPTLKSRGKLHIIYQLTHGSVDESNKAILKKLFHKKEVFIDPRYPVYRI